LNALRTDPLQRVGTQILGLWAAIGIAWGGIAHGQEAQRFTLQQAIDYAWAHQPKIRTAEEAVHTAQAQVQEAKSHLLPSVTLTGAYTYNGKLAKNVLDFGGANPFATLGGDQPEGDAQPTDQPEMPVTTDSANKPIEIEIGTKRDYRGIAQLQQPLYTSGKALNAYHAVKYGLTAAQYALESARQEVALSVTEAFYGVLLTRELIHVSQKAQEQAERRRQTAQDRFDAGVATKLDVLQAQVGLANMNTQIIRARNANKLAQEGFALALGMDPRTPVELDGSLELESVAEMDVNALLQKAMQMRPDLKALREQEEAARRLVTVAKAGNLPNVALTGTYTWNDTEKQDGQTTWSIGVGVSIPIFDGFATRAKTRQARSSVAQVLLGQEALSNGIVLQVRQAYLAYQEAAAVLEAQQETLAQADEALRIANLSFENGILTSVELADVELGRTQAELSHVQAQHDALIALARLQRAVGAAVQ
jgi:outer membrane protein TolC